MSVIIIPKKWVNLIKSKKILGFKESDIIPELAHKVRQLSERGESLIMILGVQKKLKVMDLKIINNLKTNFMEEVLE